MAELRQQIIKELGVTPTIQPEQEVQRRVNFLQSYLADAGARGYVLGISGGQDSLLAGYLAQRAVTKLREQGYGASFHAMLLPYGTQADRADAEAAIEFIKPDEIYDLNIKSSVDALADEFTVATSESLADFDKGNVKARMRMIAQYALAGTHGLLVVGCDHAAEAVTGFYTKYGDGGADVMPLAGLTKRQGRALLQYIGAPEVFYTKEPTADLLDEAPLQSDATELGLTYDEIDDYLEGKPVSPEVAAKIEALFIRTQHKRQMPAAPPAVL
ncbi:MAG: ammonia-dependent NAD(+) synthetase [Candidatus Saccharibacteria bacterium]|nr:ammonia-dependent NAD(+) synthetase [Candidatus Saccharibacteria bacterium]